MPSALICALCLAASPGDATVDPALETEPSASPAMGRLVLAHVLPLTVAAGSVALAVSHGYGGGRIVVDSSAGLAGAILLGAGSAFLAYRLFHDPHAPSGELGNWSGAPQGLAGLLLGGILGTAAGIALLESVAHGSFGWGAAGAALGGATVGLGVGLVSIGLANFRHPSVFILGAAEMPLAGVAGWALARPVR